MKTKKDLEKALPKKIGNFKKLLIAYSFVLPLSILISLPFLIVGLIIGNTIVIGLLVFLFSNVSSTVFIFLPTFYGNYSVFPKWYLKLWGIWIHHLRLEVIRKWLNEHREIQKYIKLKQKKYIKLKQKFEEL